MPDGEDPRFLQEQIITYIGNKRALLPAIERGVQTVRDRLARPQLRIADLFSGSGIVARALKRHSTHLLVNDLETYSRIANECFLANRSSVPLEELEEKRVRLEEWIRVHWAPGFITELYAPTQDQAIQPGERVFYTRRNATYLDTARRAIAMLPIEDQHYFLGPLLAAASIHANTSGVFKGFYKREDGVGQFGGTGRNALTRILAEIRLACPVLSRFETSVEVRQRDANVLAGEMEEVDLAYIDPPYNQHPYGSNYFMLNVLAEYVRPERVSEVSGIPENWNRSRFNKRHEVEAAFTELVARCPAKFLLISYNSEGFLSRAQLEAVLRGFGAVSTVEIEYNTFRGSRNLRGRPIHVTEFLFLLEKH